MSYDKYSKYFLSLLLLLLIVVLFNRYYDYVSNKNYIIKLNTVCDPEKELCFKSESFDLNFGYENYKKITILARYAPKCLEEHSCESFSCPSELSSEECNIVYCEIDTIEDEAETCVYKK